MKKFLIVAMALIALLAVPAKDTHAQIIRPVTISSSDSLLTNADTAYIALTFDGSYKSVEAWVEEISGTTGGKVYLQGKLPHNGVSVSADWASLDSLTLADQAAAQYKLFNVPNPRTYAAYRLVFLKSGSGTARIKAWYVRYTGGALFHRDPYQGMAALSDRYTGLVYQSPPLINSFAYQPEFHSSDRGL
ncbi:MAG: hypothetical protein ACTHMV_13595 [Chitinophagaceae bacterium]